MVAGANNYYTSIAGVFNFLYPVIGSCAFYLYSFLKKGAQDEKEMGNSNPGGFSFCCNLPL